MKTKILLKALFVVALAFVGLNESSAQDWPEFPPVVCEGGTVIGGNLYRNSHCCMFNTCGFPPTGYDVKTYQVDTDGDGFVDCNTFNVHYAVATCWC